MLNIHSRKTVLSIVFCLTFDDYNMTAHKTIILLRSTDYNDNLMCHFLACILSLCV